MRGAILTRLNLLLIFFTIIGNRDDYKAVRHDHIAYRYEILDILGKGSFGQVLKVFDHKKKEEKAIKIIRNQQKFHYQVKFEIKILKYLAQRQCEDYNIIQVGDCFLFRGHQCLVFDLLSINLYEFLRNQKPKVVMKAVMHFVYCPLLFE